MNANPSITIRCEAEFKRRLEALAKAEDLTVSQLVRRHFTGLLATTRRVSAATDSAGRRATPRRKGAAQ